MITTRRHFIHNLGVAGLFGKVAFLTNNKAEASRVSMPIPPVQRKKKTETKIKLPYRYTQERFKDRRTKSNLQHTKPRLKARSLRAKATLNTPGNRRALALTMWGEARGYGTLGMRCVGHVIMNRVKLNRSRFGIGIEGVCYRRKQFSCHNPGEDNALKMRELPDMDENHPDWIAFLKADKLAGQIISGALPDITGGATFYVAEGVRPYWLHHMTIIGVMYGHVFFKEKPRKLRKQKKNRSHK